MNLLPLLQQTLDPEIISASAEQIKASTNPAQVYRVSLRHKHTRALPETLILKKIKPDWPDDPHGADREVNFYTFLSNRLDLPHPEVFFAGCEPESRARLVLLRDLQTYRFPHRTHHWTMPEAYCFLRTYARLHNPGAYGALSTTDWLFPRHEIQLDPENILSQAAALAARGVWNPIPGLEGLIAWVVSLSSEMQRLAPSLIHNDVFPPNIGLPADLSGNAILLDWEMAGTGLPEMDLAFLFIQPYFSAFRLDRAALLAYYWEQREKSGKAIPSPEDREVRQRYADALWGLWLVPVAYRRMSEPFPPDSSPTHYWASMFTVLHAWLGDLSERFR